MLQDEENEAKSRAEADASSTEASSTAMSITSSHRASRRIPVALILALSLCLLLVVFFFVIVFRDVLITRSDLLTPDQRLAYTTGTAFGATLISFFITTQIRAEWIRCIDWELERGDQGALPEGFEKRWRITLGVADIKEWITNTAAWPVLLSFLICAWISTSIVSAVALTETTSSVAFTPSISRGDDFSCAGHLPKSSIFKNEQFVWRLSGNDTYHAPALKRPCPSTWSLPSLGLINTQTPDEYAYTMDGVAVQPGAIGTPRVLFSQKYKVFGERTALQDAVTTYGQSLRSVSQCTPVLKENPVSCVQGGRIDLDPDPQKPNHTLVNITTPSPCYSNSTSFEPQMVGNRMINGVCEESAVGKLFVSFAGLGYFAANLAVMMGDRGWLESNYDAGNMSTEPYTVGCRLDVADKLAWRNVTLGFQQDGPAALPFRQHVSAGEACPAAGPLGLAYAGVAASGLFAPVMENWNFDGWVSGLVSATQTGAAQTASAVHSYIPQQPRAAPWAFANSQNALEDVLGLAAGMALANLPATDVAGDGAALPMMPLQGSAEVSMVRVGSSNRLALLYALPLLAAAAFAVVLLVRVPWAHAQHQTSRLGDLLVLGRKMYPNAKA